MPTVDLKSVTLHYDSYGDESLPTVLLIMGLSMPSTAWPKEFIEKLLVKGLRVITADNRDSGRSSFFTSEKNTVSVPVAIGRALLRLPVSAPYRLEDMALDFIHLLDHLKIPKAHVVGVSMGGMIAQVMASIRPSRINSLTSVMSASGNPRTGFGKIKAIYSILTQTDHDEDEALRRKHLTDIFVTLKSPHYQYEGEVQAQMIDSVLQFPLKPDAGERQLLAILASGDRSSQLARINTPALVIHGEDDPLLPISAGKEVAELIKNSKFIPLPQMGHDLTPLHWDLIVNAIASLVWSNTN